MLHFYATLLFFFPFFFLQPPKWPQFQPPTGQETYFCTRGLKGPLQDHTLTLNNFLSLLSYSTGTHCFSHSLPKDNSPNPHKEIPTNLINRLPFVADVRSVNLITKITRDNARPDKGGRYGNGAEENPGICLHNLSFSYELCHLCDVFSFTFFFISTTEKIFMRWVITDFQFFRKLFRFR